MCREVQDFLKQAGVATSPVEVEELFALFDNDRDGSISLEEFESLAASIADKTQK